MSNGTPEKGPLEVTWGTKKVDKKRRKGGLQICPRKDETKREEFTRKGVESTSCEEEALIKKSKNLNRGTQVGGILSECPKGGE